jgi:hypothetical protein
MLPNRAEHCLTGLSGAEGCSLANFQAVFGNLAGAVARPWSLDIFRLSGFSAEGAISK